MDISSQIGSFVANLQEYSGRKLRRPDDLSIILELAGSKSLQDTLDRLSFLAKFTVKSRKIMERIGSGAEGYDKLSGELTSSVTEIGSLLKLLADAGSEATRSHIIETYLTKRPEALLSLFDLLSDLTWYKNWTIDHRDWKLRQIP